MITHAHTHTYIRICVVVLYTNNEKLIKSYIKRDVKQQQGCFIDFILTSKQN